jgi:hypothetical protein
MCIPNPGTVYSSAQLSVSQKIVRFAGRNKKIQKFPFRKSGVTAEI